MDQALQVTAAAKLHSCGMEGQGAASPRGHQPGTCPTHEILLCPIDRHKLFIVLQLSGGSEICQFVDALPVLSHEPHDVPGFDVSVDDAVLTEVVHPCHWAHGGGSSIRVWGCSTGLQGGQFEFGNVRRAGEGMNPTVVALKWGPV